MASERLRIRFETNERSGWLTVFAEDTETNEEHYLGTIAPVGPKKGKPGEFEGPWRSDGRLGVLMEFSEWKSAKEAMYQVRTKLTAMMKARGAYDE